MNPLKLIKYLAEYGPLLMELFAAIGKLSTLSNAEKRALAIEALTTALEHIKHRAGALGQANQLTDPPAASCANDPAQSLP
jgi:hypothetical protein